MRALAHPAVFNQNLRDDTPDKTGGLFDINFVEEFGTVAVSPTAIYEVFIIYNLIYILIYIMYFYIMYCSL